MIGAARDTGESCLRPVGRKAGVAKRFAFGRLDIGEADPAACKRAPVDVSLMARDVDADYVIAQRCKLDPGIGPRADQDGSSENTAGSSERNDHSAAHET